MKKVKTIFLSLLLVIASAFIASCSCSDEDIIYNQILETDISIRCKTDTVESSVDSESGILTLSCHVGDTFVIEYTLSPESVTTTQVDWSFSDTIGILKANTYSYAKSAVEEVTFSANKEGDTVISFVTKATGKRAEARVSVYAKREDVPELCKPTGVKYIPETGIVSWNHVTQVISKGNTQSATLVGGKVDGLQHYEVSYVEIKYQSNGESYYDTDTETTIYTEDNKLEGLKTGTTYAVRVKPIGDSKKARTGDSSDEYRFHQIPVVSDLKANNGNVSFTVPKFSASYKAYCTDALTITSSTVGSAGGVISNMGGKLATFKCSDFVAEEGKTLSQYNLTVQAFPDKYESTLGRSVIGGINYFPSVPSETKVITKLATPTATIENKTGNVSVAGKEFSDVKIGSQMALGGRESAKVYYQYLILDRIASSSDEAIIKGTNSPITIPQTDFSASQIVNINGTNVEVKNTQSYIDLVGEGDKTLFVRLFGDPSDSITSSWQIVSYTMLKKYTSVSGVNIVDGIINIPLRPQDSMPKPKYLGNSAEVYFINTANLDSSRMYEATTLSEDESSVSLDISELPLDLGEYSIYIRLAGSEESHSATGSVSDTAVVNPITLLGSVSNVSLKTNGEVIFAPVNGVSEYSLTLGDETKTLTESGTSGTIKLLKVDNKYKFSVYDLGLDIIPGEEYTMKLSALGDGSNTIALNLDEAITFSKYITIDTDNIVLGTGSSLIFGAVAETARYVIGIVNGGNTIYSTPTVLTKDGESVTMNLSEILDASGTKYMDKYLKTTSNGDVEFKLYAVGDSSHLDSDVATKTLKCTYSVTDIGVSAEGIVSWISANPDTDAVTYTLTLSDANTGNEIFSTSNIAEKSLDIREKLQNNAGIIIAIEITEQQVGKFTNPASLRYYTGALSSVTLEKKIDGGVNKLVWNDSTSASIYTISYVQSGVEGAVTSDLSSASARQFEIVTTGEGALTVGEYAFTIMAKPSAVNGSGSTKDTPYLLASESSNEVIVKVVDSNIPVSVSADGKGVSWNGLEGVDYTVKYRENGSEVYTTVSNEEISSYTWDMSKYAGKIYDIRVIGTADFLETGVVLKDTNTYTTITKTQTIGELSGSEQKVLDGKIVVTYESENEVTIEVYEVSEDGSEYTLIPTTGYTVSKQDNEYALDMTCLSMGTHKLAFRVLVMGAEADGVIPFAQIGSKYSETYTFDKLAATIDATMSNGNLTWTHIENATSYTIDLNGEMVYVDNHSGSWQVGIAGEDGEKVYSTIGLTYDNSSSLFSYAIDLSKLAEGDTIFSIVPSASGYLNGNKTAVVVSKLKANENPALAEGGVIVFAKYEDVIMPQSVKVVVEKGEIAEESVDGGEETVQVFNVSQTFSPEVIDITTFNNGYSIDLNSVEDFDTAGTYRVKVTYIGDNGNVIDSDTKAVFVEKLSAVSKIMTLDGKISWVRVGDIKDYEVTIYDENDTRLATFDYLAEDAVDEERVAPFTLPDVINSNTLGVSNLKVFVASSTGEESDDGDIEGEEGVEETPTETYVEMPPYTPNTIYKIRLRTKSESALTSTDSIEFVFKKLQKATSVRIGTEDKYQTSPIVTWNNPNLPSARTLKYEISFVLEEGENAGVIKSGRNVDTGSTYYLVDSTKLKEFAVGNYKVSMKIFGGDSIIAGETRFGTADSPALLNSDDSEITIMNVVANKTNPQVESGILSWTKLENAYGYKIYGVDKSTSDVAMPVTYYVGSSETSYNIQDENLLGNKYWEFTIIPLISADKMVIATKDDVEHSGTTTIFRPEVLHDYAVRQGALSWRITKEDLLAYASSGATNADAYYLANKIVSTIKGIELNGGEVSEEISNLSIKPYTTVKLSYKGDPVAPDAIKIFKANGTEMQAVEEGFAYLELSYGMAEDEAGKYDISVVASGDSSSVLSSKATNSLTVIKLLTPKSWYQKIETQEIVKDENGNPKLDENGQVMTETVISHLDIHKGQALWELSQVNSTSGTLEYYTRYQVIARTGEEQVLSNIDVESDSTGIIDGKVTDGYKYSSDVKEMFTAFGTEYLRENTQYTLSVLARGTEDSETATGDIYINSNAYAFHNKVNPLATADVRVSDSKITWGTVSEDAVYSRLYVFGPFDKDASTFDSSWVSSSLNESDESVKAAQIELAKLKYLAAYNGEKVYTDEEAFKYINSGIETYKADANGSDKVRLTNKIHIIDLIGNGGDKVSQFTLTDNRDYAEGSYVIWKRDIGDGKGVIDSEDSNVLSTYKLGKTQALTKTSSGAKDYWLGTSVEGAGRFEWAQVTNANAYRVCVKETSDEDTRLIENSERISNYSHYELPDEFNSETTRYSLRIIATKLADGKDSGIADNYFYGDTVCTDDNATNEEGDVKYNEGRYLRLATPVSLIINNDTKTISWNNEQYFNQVSNYAVNYGYGTNVAKSDSIGNTPNIPTDTLTTLPSGSILIQVRALAQIGGGMGTGAWNGGDNEDGRINSPLSNSVSVTKLADPEPKLMDGVFTWGTEGDNKTGQSVTQAQVKFNSIAKTFDITTLKYEFFTEIDPKIYNNYNLVDTYRASEDVITYPITDQDIMVMYLGSKGSSNMVDDGSFYFNSKEMPLYATKLSTPSLYNVENELDENKVKWIWDTKVKAYRLMLFLNEVKYEYIIRKADDGSTGTVQIIDETSRNVYNVSNWLHNEYFVYDEGTNQIIFTLSSFDKYLTENDGYTLYAFLQAMGTENITGAETSESHRAYLSSSYSDRLTLTIPSTPRNGRYDANTGKLTWEMTTDSDKNAGYNIILQSDYILSNISEEEYNNYWLKSAKFISSGSDSTQFDFRRENTSYVASVMGYSDIQERTIYAVEQIGSYTVYVRDKALLEAVGNVTPTSYSVRAVADNYSFHITATGYNDVSTTAYKIKSATYEFIPGNNSFALFAAGDGSSYAPYVVGTRSQVNNIRYYTSSNFILNESIDMDGLKKNTDGSTLVVNETWSPIVDTFTGTIDGKGNALYNLNIGIYYRNVYNNQIDEYAFMYKNAGTIKNLNLNVNIKVSGGTSYRVEAAALAIENTGIIDNVSVDKHMLKTNDNWYSTIDITKQETREGLYVGGIVVNNYGTIENSYVNANLKALTSGYQSRVAGISTMTYGGSIIDNCYFKGEMEDSVRKSGTIEGNEVGGIVCEVYAAESFENATVISNSYVDSTARLVGTDRTSGSSYSSSTLVGGIAAMVYENVTVSNCYSLANIVVDKHNSTSQTDISGLIGYIKGENVKINDCYVVLNVTKYDNSTNISNITIVGLAPKDNAVSCVNSYYYELANNVIDTKETNVVGIKVNSLEILKNNLNPSVYTTVDSNGYPTY